LLTDTNGLDFYPSETNPFYEEEEEEESSPIVQGSVF
jgi:hypothetical protein